MLLQRIWEYLCEIVGTAQPITYQALTKMLKLWPPNTIHQLTVALERLIEEHATAADPFIAALVISKLRGGLLGQGFFECAKRAGRFHADITGPEASAFHEAEFKRKVEFWRLPLSQ